MRDLEQRVEAAAAEAEAANQSVRAVRAQLDSLVAQFRARPYKARSDVFETADETGRLQIGYRNAPAPERTGYVGFEDVFRGDEQFIAQRQRTFVDLVRGHEPVVDLGCGRGEFLKLLGDAGIGAYGVDSDAAMVELCRRKGHRVEHADGIEFLSRAPDHSLGAIFCAQVVEHLTYDDLTRFFAAAVVKLRHGGVLIAETVNPHSIQAMQGFWVDPSHIRPVPPDTAVALCWLYGFSEAVVVFPNGSGDLERDLYETGEYAVVARTPVAS